MQPLGWYVRRLRGMSAGEIAWRAQSVARDLVDRGRIVTGLIPDPALPESAPGFRTCDMSVGEWARSEEPSEKDWLATLERQGAELVRNQFSFFDLVRRDLGNPIDWNRDHASGVAAPMDLASSIDYRDFRVTGDCKLVWELNRHHQLVVLARAFRATGDRKYADGVVTQLRSWLEQNPFGRGMNWRSPLELGIRLINWVWALDLIRDSGAWEGEIRRLILTAAYRHCWEISRKYSRGSSANNHLVGEAAGVYVASSYFSGFPGAARMRAESRRILLREIEAQSYADGCTREQALGYQFFVAQFYLVAGLVAKWSGDPFPDSYWRRLEKIVEFLGCMGEGGLPLPLFGDCDDGYVLDLGGEKHDPAGLLCIGAVVFDRPDFARAAKTFREPARWLLRQEERRRFAVLLDRSPEPVLRSRAFTESGYYLLQTGEPGSTAAISVLFDCGELGLGAIAAHGHADALSITLRAFGRDILVDPGTFDYFTFPALRNYFRSTRAHNCLVVDDQDQSVMHGPFMWGTRANAQCENWSPDDSGGTVRGSHDGYTRLGGAVVHRRTVQLDGHQGILVLADETDMTGSHELALYFHFGEECSVTVVERGRIEVQVGSHRMAMDVDDRLVADVWRGVDGPQGVAGWLSRGYHRKVAVDTLRLKGRFTGKTKLVTRLRLGERSAPGGEARPAAIVAATTA